MAHDSFAARQTELLTRILQPLITKPVKILDFGCGDGLMTHFVSRAFMQATVVGVDSDRELINEAQENYQTLDFIYIDQSTLPYADNSFDVINMAQVMHHINPEKQLSTLQELKRVLKEGGQMIMIELNPWHMPTRGEFKRNPAERDAQMISIAQANKLFKQASLKKIQWHQIPFGSFYAISGSKE